MTMFKITRTTTSSYSAPAAFLSIRSTLFVWLLLQLLTSSSQRIGWGGSSAGYCSAQSYDDHNNNYGYDDPNDESESYQPRPPTTMPDNLYHDYAARQEAKVGGGGDGIALAGG
jgi:hypothetical protein